jgi:3-hydroxyisobutyrate dehydrogenase-like beta-hydroxyacid dehydrogenase
MEANIMIGFVGLGNLGSPMAQRIISTGFSTTLWARREASFAPFREGAYRRAASLRDLGQHSDVLCVCVVDDQDVRRVLLGDEGALSAMPRGGVVMIHSTIAVSTCRELAGEAATRDIAVVDAPMSGVAQDAADGTLVALVGGDEAACVRVTPILRCLSTTIHHMGPLGSGQMMKALNNVTSFCNGRIAVEAIETGSRLGLDVLSVIAALRAGGAASRMLDRIDERLRPDPPFRSHASMLIAKDTRVFEDIMTDAGMTASLLCDLAGQFAHHLVPATPPAAATES